MTLSACSWCGGIKPRRECAPCKSLLDRLRYWRQRAAERNATIPTMRAICDAAIEQALSIAAGNWTRAASLLGISRSTIGRAKSRGLQPARVVLTSSRVAPEDAQQRVANLIEQIKQRRKLRSMRLRRRAMDIGDDKRRQKR